MDRIGECVKRLTQAQKRKLLAIGDGQPKEFPWHSSGLFLIERGYAFENELGARHLTDLGHDVRKRIIGETSA